MILYRGAFLTALERLCINLRKNRKENDMLKQNKKLLVTITAIISMLVLLFSMPLVVNGEETYTLSFTDSKDYMGTV